MQDKLASKKTVSFKQPSADTPSVDASPSTGSPSPGPQKAPSLSKAQSVREVDSDDEDFQRFKNLKTDEDKDKISTRKSMIAGAGFLDKVFFGWVFNIIKKAQTNTLTVEDFGGLRDEDMIQGKIKMVEENFEKQKDKNIFLAVFQAFKWNYYYNFIGCGIHLVIHMFFPMIVGEIIRFMQDKEDTNLFYGFKLLVLLVALNCFLMLINVHTWYNNITTGCLSQKILTAMTVKKQLKLSTATSKNYEAGQIHNVRGATHRLTWFCYEASGFFMTPIWICYCTIRLFMTIGWTFIIGLSLMVFCYYFDKYFHRQIMDMKHEDQKLQEKRMNITSESFENI